MSSAHKHRLKLKLNDKAIYYFVCQDRACSVMIAMYKFHVKDLLLHGGTVRLHMYYRGRMPNINGIY